MKMHHHFWGWEDRSGPGWIHFRHLLPRATYPKQASSLWRSSGRQAQHCLLSPLLGDREKALSWDQVPSLGVPDIAQQ